jgi:NAD+ kinase
MTVEFQRIGLLGRPRQDGLGELLAQLVSLLGERGAQILLEDRLGEVLPYEGELLPREVIGERADLVIVLGGDGSLLSAARTLARYETPVLGINRGRLGFLTDIRPDAIAELVPAVLDGHYTRESRFLLDVCVEREGKAVARAEALNDVVLNSGTSAQMIEFELSIDDEFVYRQRADGLIVSTPTGSTAYALSGGGPIMHPSLDAIVLVPMFPHGLNSRPIVVRGESEIRLEVLARNRIHPPVTCDGQVNMTARPEDAVLISKKAHRLTLLHPIGHSFYASCRDKLHWSNALVS